MTPLLILDIDGVINGPRLHPDAPGDVRSHRTDVDLGCGFVVRWRHTVVTRLNAVVAAELATPVWCTTWLDRAPELGRIVGLAGQPWPVLRATGTTAGDHWWKLAAVAAAAQAAPGRRILWVDDHLTDAHRTLARQRLPATAAPLRPDTPIGLADDDLDELEATLREWGRD